MPVVAYKFESVRAANRIQRKCTKTLFLMNSDTLNGVL